MPRIKTQKEFVDRLQELYTRNVDISRRKNADYAGTEDPFKNFDAVKVVGLDPRKAILVRMMDKVTRIGNLLDRPPQVVDESVLDTLSDLSNYAMILRMYIENENAMKQEAEDDIRKPAFMDQRILTINSIHDTMMDVVDKAFQPLAEPKDLEPRIKKVIIKKKKRGARIK